MNRTELEQAIEEIITEILSESDTDKTRGTAVVPRSTSPSTIKKYTDQGVDVEVRVNEEEDDDSMPEKEPTKAELKKIDKEFGSSKFAKKLSDEEKVKLDKIEAGIKKKLANPTKDNIAIVRQLINKPEIKKLFKDGGKDLKALVSDIIA